MDRYVTVQESGKPLTEVPVLSLIVQVMTWTVLLPSIHIPPPCKGEDGFSDFITLHWGDGLLRNGSRIWDEAHIACSVVPDCAGDEMDCAAPIDGNATTLRRRCHFGEFTIGAMECYVTVQESWESGALQ